MVVMVLVSFIVWLSVVYFVGMVGLGILHLRRQGITLGSQAALSYERPHDGRDDDMFVYFLVPCLNEERVIGATVRRLVGHRAAHVLVIDDGSEDETGAIAKEAGGEAVTVLRRDLPLARQGKGAALNAGLAQVRREVRSAGQDPARVLVCVMDADGHLSDGAVAHAARLFADPAVGGVQLAVRIRNRDSYLARMQEFYFWSMAAVTQFGRAAIGTVSLGGNGQFTRLTALDEVGQTPWSTCLTEDLDLTVTLVLAGWKTTTAAQAAVSQQGVHTVAALVKQRSRWYQGHMSCARRLPDIWRSRRISHVRAVELSVYLLVPWLLDLPWSILWQLVLFQFVSNFSSYFILDHGVWAAAASVVLWYLLSFGPALATSLLHKRRAPDSRWREALLMGHSFVFMNYLFFLCVWRALFAILKGSDTWAKTARELELSAVPAPRPDASSQAAGVARAK